jgi:hypothetical protein
MLAAHASRFHARIAADPAEAEAGFQAATERFRDLEMVYWLAVSQVEHAEWLVASGRADEVGPLLAEAAEIFERLEASPWLERAGRAGRATAAGREREPVGG